ncbi:MULTISPECIES: Fe2+-dependent dioxygenase [Modicisalibacter]|uniref:Fe2+-dependent dioxygenase n=1 Tax=Modicisalibacter tunisiensis TaxID=390637 RepID=A0ABS7WX93_9GAMM|nr:MULTISPECIES: Fe2+-dependent dioxygenase [Modicisalibacter]MBZ9567242.1 Fe2+-dependent dioxygenase [Modicisalibacter tunisiensis]
MILCVADVLDAEQLAALRRDLDEDAHFRDGRETAGWHARQVKANQQADGQAPVVRQWSERLGEAIRRHPLFQMAARPARMTPVRFSRYRPGMHYGNHVDDPVMGGAAPVRTDLSFTLFLEAPEAYDGGELVTDTTAGEQRYKLPAGAMILYPSSTLHRVEPVTRGQRRVAIGWVQSQVRDPAAREILFDLDTARRGLFEREGKSETFDLMSKSLANLQRMWVEV